MYRILTPLPEKLKNSIDATVLLMNQSISTLPNDWIMQETHQEEDLINQTLMEPLHIVDTILATFKD